MARLFEVFRGRKPSDADRAIRQAYEDCFGTSSGRIVLAHLCDRFSVCASPYVKGDPHATHMRVGEQAVVLDILNWLGKRSDPASLNAMMDGELGE